MDKIIFIVEKDGKRLGTVEPATDKAQNGKDLERTLSECFPVGSVAKLPKEINSFSCQK